MLAGAAVAEAAEGEAGEGREANSDCSGPVGIVRCYCHHCQSPIPFHHRPAVAAAVEFSGGVVEIGNCSWSGMLRSWMATGLRHC